MSYATQIKAIRDDMLETQQAFASRIGITQGYLSLLESVARVPPRKKHDQITAVLRDNKHVHLDGMLKQLDDEFEEAIQAKQADKGKTVAKITLNATGTALVVKGKSIDNKFVIRYTDLLDVAEMKRVVGLFNDLICKVAM